MKFIIRKIEAISFFGKILKIFMRIRKSCGEIFGFIVLSLFVFFADQLFKNSIDQEPEDNFPRDMPYSNGKVRIIRAHNPGFTHGRLKEFPEFVKLVSLSAASFLAGLLCFLSVNEPGKYMVRKTGMALVIGGALSNVFDRARNGKVTDYINIRVGVLKNTIVNIADIAIYIGSILFMLGSLFGLIKKKD